MSEDKSSQIKSGKARKKGLSLAFFALIISFASPLLLAVAILGSHIEYFDYDMAFKTMTLGWAPKVATLSLVIALIALLISLFMSPRRTGPLALAAVVISGTVLAGFYGYEHMLKSSAPVYEVSTNWDRPVTFSDKLIKARGENAHPVIDDPRVAKGTSFEWDGKLVADVNAATCSAAQPVKNKTVDADKLAALLSQEGYMIFGRSPWRVEAVYKDPVYGFKSDMVVRLDPDQIDVRSVSRNELIDLGGNCRRVLRVLEIVKGMN